MQRRLELVSLSTSRSSSSSTSARVGPICSWLSSARPRARRRAPRALTSSRCTAALRLCELLEDQVAVPHQVDDVAVAVVEHLGDLLRALEQRLDLLVALGDAPGQPGDPVERRRDLRRGARPSSPRRRRAPRTAAGCRSPRWWWSGRRRHRRCRRPPRCCSSGIVPPRSSWPAAGGCRSRNFSPSRLSTSIDARLVRRRSRRPVVDLEVHDDRSSLEGDVADPADPDPADLDHVALVDAARVAELGVVGRAAEARELHRLKVAADHQRHHAPG